MLMRALRDFNTPKIVTDDVLIFMGLIGDLFPALNVPRKRDMDFEAMVKKAVMVSSCLDTYVDPLSSKDPTPKIIYWEDVLVLTMPYL